MPPFRLPRPPLLRPFAGLLGPCRALLALLAPLARFARRPCPRGPLRLSALLLSLALAAQFLTGWKAVDGVTPGPGGADAWTGGPDHLPAPGFATSDTCRSCHPGNYATWHASFHRTMTQEAKPANVIPQLEGLDLVLNGTRHRVERREEAFWVRSGPADAAPEALGPARKVSLLTGSHHQQNFWLEAGEYGNALEAFPFGWMIHEKRWAPLTDTFLAPPETQQGRAEGTWNNGCLNCHSTQGAPRLAADGTFTTRVTEHGISCESCHAGGAAHIAAQRNPLRRYTSYLTGGGDDLIANPGRMSGPASALACGQCHSIWAFTSAAQMAGWNEHGRSYRPGDPTLGERFVVQPTRPDHAEQKNALLAANPHFVTDSYWADGMVKVTGREYNGVEASPCFKGGDFSCLNCHEMHPKDHTRAELRTWAVSQLRTGARAQPDAACLSCHQEKAADISAHTHHAPGSVGSRCYDCHMPHTSFGLMRAVRSHEVSSPTVRESTELGRPNACNLCHLDQTLAWTAGHLKNWYGQTSPTLTPDQQRISAAVTWILKGDAGQRALIAWSMGWAPARQASGTAWLAPYLATGLNDPYSAVRFVSWKSLLTLPGFENFSYDYIASDDDTFAAATRAYELSRTLRAGLAPDARPLFPPATLLQPDGSYDRYDYPRLLDQRDQRRVFLIE